MPDPRHPDPHHRLLALAGLVPDSWLVIAREALADRDHGQLERLFGALADVGRDRVAHRFEPPATPSAHDRAVVQAVASHQAAACWRAMRAGTDPVYLVQARPGVDLAAITGAVQRVLTARGERSPRVEVFGPTTALLRYHEDALLAATLLWSAEPAEPVRVARAFDGASATDGPWFNPVRELVVAADERQRLLDFLAGGEVVLPVPDTLDDVLSRSPRPVPVDLRSDGRWVWSEASRYYLERYMLSPDPEFADHAASHAPRTALTHLERYRVRAALTPAGEEGPLWRAG
ncbi:hypothetical protein [Saccharothrix yanglingensis]|uniref:Uncharacterized protein n=1 Tax=Saccharothrix yanglingensis TaxID=659496 RepID=A0ABU0XD17_9PSEU|nr:hypothetical protein [Saccharothrix yanglingensis]MDQ2589124.1 hypothetical protein [Saccharothrix yanglingensis]